MTNYACTNCKENTKPRPCGPCPKCGHRECLNSKYVDGKLVSTRTRGLGGLIGPGKRAYRPLGLARRNSDGNPIKKGDKR